MDSTEIKYSKKSIKSDESNLELHNHVTELINLKHNNYEYKFQLQDLRIKTNLVSKLGGEENTIRSVLNAANGKLPSTGIFKDIAVNVAGEKVLIRGNVINGIPRIGTMFIP